MRWSFPVSPMVLALSFLINTGAAQAATVYRWVDQQGKTHYASMVPKAYKDVAEAINLAVVEPSPEQRGRATARAAEQKAAAAELSPTSSESDARPSAATLEKAQRPAKQPAKAPTKDTDCETWRRLFKESGECFAPYRVVGGGTKKEAFEQCTPVVEPPGRCQ